MSDYFAPCNFLLVEPNDSQRVKVKMADLAQYCHENFGFTGAIEVSGTFYDSLNRAHETKIPYHMNIDTFYRDGVRIEDPLSKDKA